MARTRVHSIPAPFGGWNTKDPMPSMKPIYAPVLDNVFCQPSEIQVRKGWSSWATGISGTVESLMNYSGAAGTYKLWAASNNAGTCQIYDITASGAVGAAAVSGLTSARFRQCHFSNTGGFYSYYVNGADSLRLYDGSAWSTVTSGGGATQISGTVTTIFVDVIAHKRRLWFVKDGELKAYYLATDAIYGAATTYDFAPIFPRGGKIVKLDTWSLDAGTGLDDYFLIFTSEGEVAVYQGIDPASASTWSLKGVFYIGQPLVPARTLKYGGDVLILNRDGLANMSYSLMSSRVDTKTELTDLVASTLASDVVSYGATYGWSLELFPTEGMLIINIPVSSSTSYQYVMNTTTGAWSRWTGIYARCLLATNDRLLFGGSGHVGRMWSGQNDNGSYILADILPAYQNFGSMSQLKRWPLTRVTIGADGQCSYGVRMEVDYNLNMNPVVLPSTTEASYVYDTATYDNATYGGNVSIESKWHNTMGIGYAASPHIQIKTTYVDARLYSFDVVVEPGGVV